MHNSGMLRIIVMTFLAVNFFIGCQTKPDAPFNANSPVVGRAGDVSITSEVLLKQIEKIERRTPQVLDTHHQKKELLRQMLNVEVLFQEALRQKFDESYEFKSRLVQAYIDSIAEEARAKITDDVIAKEYELNSRLYDQVAARHIILRTERLSPEEDRAKYDLLKGLREELIANPDKFSDYAIKYSEDPAARKGGQLGFFRYEQMVPEFSSAAFALREKGDVSGIVKTQYGYHLIQLVDEKRGLSHYKNEIKNKLILEYQKQAFQSELERLKSKIDFEIYESNLLKLSTLPPAVEQDPNELIPTDALQNKK